MSKRNGKSNGQANPLAENARLAVLKTYKIYVNGQFPRGESGRYYVLKNPHGQSIANICDCSRKDFRDAVTAARSVQGGWASRSAYNRSQILYRIAEMLEGRKSQFVEELSQLGLPASAGVAEVQTSIDRLVYYAGWTDKYQQIFSSVNPASSSHFNFSLLEPAGVVSIISPEGSGLIGLVSVIAPVVCGGNTCVVLASNTKPLPAITLGEVLATSDLPAGVVNILTGRRSELIEHFASHMDVNACIYCGDDRKELQTIREKASMNVKRVLAYDQTAWLSENAQGPYFISDMQEVKTTWHPIGL